MSRRKPSGRRQESIFRFSGTVTFLAKDVQLSFSSGTPRSCLAGGLLGIEETAAYAIPANSLNRLGRAKTMAYIKKKFPDLQTSGIPLLRLSAHWQVKDGLITIDDGLLASTDIKAGWAGKIDPCGRGSTPRFGCKFTKRIQSSSPLSRNAIKPCRLSGASRDCGRNGPCARSAPAKFLPPCSPSSAEPSARSRPNTCNRQATLKYFASGWCTTMADVLCSGTS